jgi:hypothetical protein
MKNLIEYVLRTWFVWFVLGTVVALSIIMYVS